MKRLWIPALLLLFLQGHAQQLQREEFILPDVMGYQALKCDFHIHTVFSDGKVWPTARIHEAWKDGFDAISITDHIEYQPHKDYIPVNHNAGYEIALQEAKRRNILLIRGSEITRTMPPGHMNAIFLEDASALETSRVRESLENGRNTYDRPPSDWMEPVKSAIDQGAFIMWNHPGWKSQAPDGIRIYDEHLKLIEQGYLHGIEVANWDEWYPEALSWAYKYDLAPLSNSDIHEPYGQFLDLSGLDHRPATIVLVRERSLEGIREALDHARTLVWFDNQLIGKEEYLEPLFKNSLEIRPAHFTNDHGDRWINIRNTSGLMYLIEIPETEGKYPLKPYHSVVVKLNPNQEDISVNVSNLIPAPGRTFSTVLEID